VIGAVYACPFHAEGSVEGYIHPDHPDRKPNPGMLIRAIADPAEIDATAWAALLSAQPSSTPFVSLPYLRALHESASINDTLSLFLERFVPAGVPWLHLDTFAWTPAAKPGRPKGGEASALRALWRHLEICYGTGAPPRS